MSLNIEELRKNGPPYPLPGELVGGVPKKSVDIAVCAVLLCFFVFGAVFNMTVLQINRRRGHKFLLSGLFFGFCMARTTALVMRIVWATRPSNIRISIAAQIFVAAGVVLLFVANIVLTQRLVRAYHPRVGWQRFANVLFRLLFVLIIASLIMVITAIVVMFYTLDPQRRQRCRDVQLTAVTIMLAMAFLPIPILITFCGILPRRASHNQEVEAFGSGSMRIKVLLVLATSALLTLGAGFRCGTAFDIRFTPAWFHHRAAFYCFNFVVELIVIYSYMLTRFDRRFHVPDGSSGPGHYSRATATKEELMD